MHALGDEGGRPPVSELGGFYPAKTMVFAKTSEFFSFEIVVTY